MEHYNPLLNITSDQKFITIGEIMLRLTPPNYEKIRLATNFEASYGGSEANIALALANLGVDRTFFTVVPGKERHPHAAQQRRALYAGDSHHAGADADPPAGHLLPGDRLWNPRQQGDLRPEAQRHHGV